ncbi:MAG: iron-sulfur cluster assembly scaffold protein [Eubacteriales bacterium]|nr:iron-sulfur cluster assembly scaffold protein [Eubacteriales bacterium]
MYNEKVIEHFTNPRNVGEIENPDGTGMITSESCGDMMKLTIKIEDGRIVDAKFKTFGCGAAIASSSAATEMIKGMTLEEAEKFTNKRVLEELGGLPDVKIHCSMLAEDALHAALKDYREHHQK